MVELGKKFDLSDVFEKISSNKQLAGHEIKEIYRSNELATFEVIVLDNEKKYYKFK